MADIFGPYSDIPSMSSNSQSVNYATPRREGFVSSTRPPSAAGTKFGDEVGFVKYMLRNKCTICSFDSVIGKTRNVSETEENIILMHGWKKVYGMCEMKLFGELNWNYNNKLFY